MDVFLKYLDDWEKSVEKREGFTKEEKNLMLLSHETRLGLRITGEDNLIYMYVYDAYMNFSFLVHSFIELVKYLLSIPEVSVFISNKLSQDPIEKFFGQQRQRGSSNDNPNVSQFIKATQALRVINITCADIKGNCRGSSHKIEKTQKWIEDKENKTLPRRKYEKK